MVKCYSFFCCQHFYCSTFKFTGLFYRLQVIVKFTFNSVALWDSIGCGVKIWNSVSWPYIDFVTRNICFICVWQILCSIFCRFYAVQRYRVWSQVLPVISNTVNCLFWDPFIFTTFAMLILTQTKNGAPISVSYTFHINQMRNVFL